MKTKKTVLCLLLGAMIFGCFTAKAQDNQKKWQYIDAFSVHFDFIQSNKGWKPAMGSRPGGFGVGFGLEIGAKYDNLFAAFSADISVSGNFKFNGENCTFFSGLIGPKIGYTFLKDKENNTDFGLTFVTGLLFGSNNLNYDFKTKGNDVTVQDAKNYSANFRQGAMYVPLELRMGDKDAYIGLAYMLPVWHADASTGYGTTSKVKDAPNTNVLPLRLIIGFNW